MRKLITDMCKYYRKQSNMSQDEPLNINSSKKKVSERHTKNLIFLFNKQKGNNNTDHDSWPVIYCVY